MVVGIWWRVLIAFDIFYCENSNIVQVFDKELQLHMISFIVKFKYCDKILVKFNCLLLEDNIYYCATTETLTSIIVI